MVDKDQFKTVVRRPFNANLSNFGFVESMADFAAIMHLHENHYIKRADVAGIRASARVLNY
ncbi:hypothetical protein B1H42_09755 [Enterobacter cloacae subsp. cloacae]|nr:hypothetical protein B1H42_09755 [Enterobacter cloacae subsp. cloacae]ORC31553.1 hypothetical protein B2M05_09315 [Enterobacter cloacae subsp. cloacae]